MNKQFRKFLISTTAVAVSSLALVGTSFADRGYSSNSDYVMADVVRSEPIYKTVTVSRPERVCEEVEVYDRDRRYNRRARHRQHDTAGGTIAGGVIGGVIGRQIGKGSGRDAATIAGVLIGSAIGHDNAEKNRSRHSRRDRRHDEYTVRTEQRCRVNTERFTEERLDGYRVTYFLNGQEYQTRTRKEPGSKIRVRVTVQPVNEGYYDSSDDDGYYESRYERSDYDDDDYDRYDYDDDD